MILFFMLTTISEPFGLILQNLNLICVIGTVETYLGFWRERLNFGITIVEIRAFWLNIAKFGVYLRYRHCSKLFRKLRKNSSLAFSLYTAIMGRPWLHSLGAVFSTLHQKAKYPSGGQVLEIVGSQSMARQCLVAAIQHKPETGTSASKESNL